MLIDSVSPLVVGARSDLPARLVTEGKSRGLSQVKIDALLSILPRPLRDAGAFQDRLSGLWRYEFGLPYHSGESLVWGTHMWEQVITCLMPSLALYDCRVVQC